MRIFPIRAARPPRSPARSFVRVFFWGEEGAGREGGAPPSSGESKGEISKTRDEQGPPPAGPSDGRADGRKNFTLEDAKRLRLQISVPYRCTAYELQTLPHPPHPKSSLPLRGGTLKMSKSAFLNGSATCFVVERRSAPQSSVESTHRLAKQVNSSNFKTE